MKFVSFLSQNLSSRRKHNMESRWQKDITLFWVCATHFLADSSILVFFVCFNSQTKIRLEEIKISSIFGGIIGEFVEQDLWDYLMSRSQYCFLTEVILLWAPIEGARQCIDKCFFFPALCLIIKTYQTPL